jgi:hypothetical protein
VGGWGGGLKKMPSRSQEGSWSNAARACLCMCAHVCDVGGGEGCQCETATQLQGANA